MLFGAVNMLKKKLGIEVIEKDGCKRTWFKIPSLLIIPEGCKRIGWRSFWGCKKLKKVIIPKSVEVIKNYVFVGCEKATIILRKPKSEFKEIARSAFNGCRYVKEEIRN